MFVSHYEVSKLILIKLLFNVKIVLETNLFFLCHIKDDYSFFETLSKLQILDILTSFYFIMSKLLFRS